MKTQWQIYRALELIPETTPHRQANVWARLVAPVRRSLADAFVRDLSYKHQVLLLKRCLDMANGEMPQCHSKQQPTVQSEIHDREQEVPQGNRPAQTLAAQQWLNRGGLPWWTWYDL